MADKGTKKNRWLWTGGATSVILGAALVGGTWGVAYGQTAPAAAPPTTAAGVATSLTGAAPSTVSSTLSGNSGGTIVAGNVGLSVASGAVGAASGDLTVNITANPSIAGLNLGGPSTFSPNGTVIGIDIHDANGVPIHTFTQPVTIVAKPIAADLTMASAKAAGGGQSAPAGGVLALRVFQQSTQVQSPINLLTLAYVVDSDTPEPANPNHYPVNTLIVAPPSSVTVDAVNGTISASLNFLTRLLAVVTTPVGWVKTLNPEAAEYSSFDPATSQTFSKLKQFTTLQVVEPQIGTRLMVIDPATNNFAYVNAGDVAPSGPPNS